MANEQQQVFPLQEGIPQARYRADFSGGVNLYLGARQIKDSESPNSTDCDFIGATGVGSRQGYAHQGTVISGRTTGLGLGEFHITGTDQTVRFASNGSNTTLAYYNGSSWTEPSGSLTSATANVDTVEAGISSSSTGLFTFNGVDSMYKWDGTSFAAYSVGKVLLYGAYFDLRLWGVDPANPDTLVFSTKNGDSTKPLDFTATGTSSDKGTVTINPGSGIPIRGIKVFKNSLYVFLQNSVYQISTTSTINIFSVTLVTNSIGCVSHRSIAVIENDIFFASDNGVYTLGEVGTFVSVRATNRSLPIQKVFDSLTGAVKAKLVGRYANYKYHLFYSLFGANNDSCMVYDIRYQGWQDWRNIAANDAILFRDSTNTLNFYFLEPTTGKVQQLYSGTTNDGSVINSVWYSKSFDEQMPDTQKLFFDSTFIFGLLNGTVEVAVIFNDTEITVPSQITQSNPQGGYGRDAYGRKPYGDETNVVTVVQTINQPQRLKAKGQKFAIQYRVTSTGSWRLDTVSQWLQTFNHYKFPSANKLN